MSVHNYHASSPLALVLMSAVSLTEAASCESSIVLGLEILCKVWRGSLRDLWLPQSVFRRMQGILCVPVHNQHGGLGILEAVQKPFSGSFFFFFFPLVYSGLLLPKNPKISPAKFSLILISIVLLFIICGFVGNSKGRSRGLFAKFYSANPNIWSMLEVVFFF